MPRKEGSPPLMRLALEALFATMRHINLHLPVSRSNVKITRPINADRHRVPYLPNGKAYVLQTWYMDGGRRLASVTGAMISKVKGQNRKVT